MSLTKEREQVAHLLRRFGIAASAVDVESYGKAGIKGAIARLRNPRPVEGVETPPSQAVGVKH